MTLTEGKGFTKVTQLFSDRDGIQTQATLTLLHHVNLVMPWAAILVTSQRVLKGWVCSYHHLQAKTFIITSGLAKKVTRESKSTNELLGKVYSFLRERHREEMAPSAGD